MVTLRDTLGFFPFHPSITYHHRQRVNGTDRRPLKFLSNKCQIVGWWKIEDQIQLLGPNLWKMFETWSSIDYKLRVCLRDFEWMNVCILCRKIIILRFVKVSNQFAKASWKGKESKNERMISHSDQETKVFGNLRPKPDRTRRLKPVIRGMMVNNSSGLSS